MDIQVQLAVKPIKVTDNAVEKVKQLLIEEGNPGLKLRVYVTGGGCSGFQYGFKFDDEVNEGDTNIEDKGVVVVLDPMSYQYLAGSEVDFIDDLEGARFVINNPNAASTCGCGASFSV